jgi:hypothetical protein
MYRTFGDVFAYRSTGEYHYTLSARWFHDCILLKDIGAETAHIGSKISCIQVESTGRMWVCAENSGTIYEYVDTGITQPPTFEQIILDVRSSFDKSHVSTLVALDMKRDLEDYYGIVFGDGDAAIRKFISLSFCNILSARIASTNKISTCFRRAISDPSYQMCRNRLMREFGEGIF